MSDLNQFLQAYPEAPHGLVIQARTLILAVLPQAIEQFDPSANLIGYGTDRGYKGLVFGIILYRSYINLMFSQGASLPDPGDLLLGTGKKARHFKITCAEDVANPALLALLQAAINIKPSTQ